MTKLLIHALRHLLCDCDCVCVCVHQHIEPSKLVWTHACVLTTIEVLRGPQTCPLSGSSEGYSPSSCTTPTNLSQHCLLVSSCSNVHSYASAESPHPKEHLQCPKCWEVLEQTRRQHCDPQTSNSTAHTTWCCQNAFYASTYSLCVPVCLYTYIYVFG